MKIKKIFLSMLLMIVAICFCPTKVFATSTIERTTTLDVSKMRKIKKKDGVGIQLQIH